jgi:hypothetical protein
MSDNKLTRSRDNSSSQDRNDRKNLQEKLTSLQLLRRTATEGARALLTAGVQLPQAYRHLFISHFMTRLFLNFFSVEGGGGGCIIVQNAPRDRSDPQTQFLNVMTHNHDERHGARCSLVEAHRHSEERITSILRVQKL